MHTATRALTGLVAILLLASACAPAPSAPPTAVKPTQPAAAAAAPTAAPAAPTAVPAAPTAAPAATAAPKPAATGAAGPAGRKIRVALDQYGPPYAPTEVADQLGIFQKHGVEVEFIKVSGGQASLAALVSSTIDVLQAQPSSILALRGQGRDVRIIFTSLRNFTHSLMCATDIPLPHEKEGYPAVAQDLKGRKIGVTQAGASTEQIARYLFLNAGMDPDKDVSIIAIGAASYVTALQTKQVDCVEAFSPNDGLILAQNAGRKVIDMQAGQGPAAFTKAAYVVNVVMANFLKQNRPLVEAYAAAVADAQAILRNDADAGTTALMEWLKKNQVPIDEPSLRADMKALAAGFTPAYTPEQFAATQDFVLKLGLIQQPLKYEEIVEPFWK